MAKWCCKECEEVNEHRLTAPNPFDDGETNIYGCASCGLAETTVRACDATDCPKIAVLYGTGTDGKFHCCCIEHTDIMQAVPQGRWRMV